LPPVLCFDGCLRRHGDSVGCWLCVVVCGWRGRWAWKKWFTISITNAGAKRVHLGKMDFFVHLAKMDFVVKMYLTFVT
jgi:hypothetical protein